MGHVTTLLGSAVGDLTPGYPSIDRWRDEGGAEGQTMLTGASLWLVVTESATAQSDCSSFASFERTKMAENNTKDYRCMYYAGGNPTRNGRTLHGKARGTASS